MTRVEPADARPVFSDDAARARRRTVCRLLVSAAVALTLAACSGGHRHASYAVTGATTQFAAPPAADDSGMALQSATPGQYDYSGMKPVKIDGQTLRPDAALERMNRDLGTIVAQTPAEPDPIAGRLRIVLADHDRLRAITAPLALVGGNALADYGAEELRLGEHGAADVLVRSHLFASATLVEQNDTLNPAAEGADYVLWYQVWSSKPNNAGPFVGGWRLRRASGQAVAAISFDPGTAAGLPRYLSFVQSVRAAAGTPGTGIAATGTSGGVTKEGSGIVVDANGHVLTNNHVIDSCRNLRVTDTGGTASPATLVAADATNDLAVLKTERHWPTWASFRDSRALRPGEAVVVAGFPLSGLLSPEMAVNTGSLTALSGLRGDSRLFQFSAPIQPGNSGGPVLDSSGRVLGIATSGLNGLALAAATGALPQNVNFAIKTSTARSFLDDNSVTLDTAAPGHTLDPAGVGDVARRFTVKVECF